MNPNIARRRRAKAAEHQDHIAGDHPAGHNTARHNRGREHSAINVGHTERQLSMVAGTALAVYGLLQRSTSGFLLAALGGALIWRGHTGHCHVYQTLGHTSAAHPPTPDAT